MALKSPVPFHDYWGHIADPTELPNVSGATIQDSALETGDIAWVTSKTSLYQCTTATVGAAVWTSLMDDPDAIHDDVAGEINASPQLPASACVLTTSRTVPPIAMDSPAAVA